MELYFEERTFKNYTTFIPLLLRVMAITKGKVVELGGGLYSTPLLHWMCKEQHRRVRTYERDPQYYELCRRFVSPTHEVIKVEDWSTQRIPGKFSVVLVDHDGFKDDTRAMSALSLKDRVEFIILHDTNHPEYYGYKKIYPQFKYRYTWKEEKPWTTVVSNLREMPWE